MKTRKSASKLNRSGIERNRVARLAASLLIVSGLSFIAGPSVMAAPTQKLSDIDRVEKKLFQSVDSKRSMAERLDRIEKRVFGEAKEGTPDARMAAIMEVVPDLEEDDTPQQASSSSSSNSSSGQDTTASSNAAASEPKERLDAGTEYPAVSAIEKKLFGKEFANEEVGKRLARLETKVFGKPSSSDDMAERTDRLKTSTGIDIAKNAPLGTDWADEDEADVDYPEPSAPVSRGYSSPLQSKPGEDGMSYSGRNIRQDFEKAFGRRPGGPGGFSGSGGSGGSGSYGMSGSRGFSGSGSSGSYGFGGGSSTIGGGDSDDNDRQLAFTPRSSSMPPTAPPIRRGAPSGGAGGMGLNQQVEGLENEIFGKSYRSDPLISRIDRLEKTIFPNASSHPASPGDRVAKLLSVVPVSSSHTVAQNTPFNNDPDDQDMSDPPAVYSSATPDPSSQIPGQKRGGGGFGKMLNSIGNFIGGGMSVGGFPMQSGNLYTDPQSGLLIDRLTGNMIDPRSGMVIGRRSAGYPGTVSPYGGYNSYNSFNNGFSNYRNPYSGGVGGFGMGGMGSGMGSGMGFGTGFGSFGGMWP
ncbi:MAG: hypothetical protein K2Z81_26025 [Cyanobacteria bacterium]|nr:hypothetical protein [Cyanobacteriota bacterium]